MLFGRSFLWVLSIPKVLAVIDSGPDHTWWVDESCTKYFQNGEFDKIMGEVIQTSHLINYRMSRSRQEEPQAYDAFNAIFKFRHNTRDEEELKLLRWFTGLYMEDGGIGMFQKESLEGDDGRKASEVRFYCDDDKRWTRIPDDELPTSVSGPNGQKIEIKKNSDRDPEHQEWVDRTNKIRIIGMPYCRRNHLEGGSFKASMNEAHGPWPGEDDPRENSLRSTITICDLSLDYKSKYNTIGEFSLNSDLEEKKEGEVPLDAWSAITSMTILHEIHHIRRYYRRDIAYKWNNIISLKKDEAIVNAESFMFFGILMWGLERGYKLDLDHLAEGAWKKDNRITKRWKASSRKRTAKYISCDEMAQQTPTKTNLLCQEFWA